MTEAFQNAFLQSLRQFHETKLYEKQMAHEKKLLEMQNDLSAKTAQNKLITKFLTTKRTMTNPKTGWQIEAFQGNMADREVEGYKLGKPTEKPFTKLFGTNKKGEKVHLGFVKGDKFISKDEMLSYEDKKRIASKYQKPLTSVDVKVGQRGMSEMAEKMSESLVKRRDEVEKLASSYPQLQEAENLLNSGMITGIGADFIKNAGKVLQRIGVSYFDDPIANTETYFSVMASQTARIIQEFGSGTGLSDADREYANKAAGGDISVSKKALERIIKIRKKVSVGAIRNFNKKAKQTMSKPGADQLPYNLIIDIPDVGTRPTTAEEYMKSKGLL